MNEIKIEKDLIAYCGLYCGACPRFQNGKCSGCRNNEKLGWCKIRSCNSENGYHNCSECRLMNFEDCRLNHNLISKFFGFVFRSDRDACITRIKQAGALRFAEERAADRCHTIKKKRGN